MGKRPLLVFAGQSNMMGASTLPASEQVYFKSSFEYLHKPRRMGKPVGEFKDYGFPTGEFSYKCMTEAYGDITDPDFKSELTDYSQNTHFCPAMCNLDEASGREMSFAVFSEKTAGFGVCMAPFVVKGLEEAGIPTAYTHIAKGGVSIQHYLEGDSAEYFDRKVLDFFEDSQKQFPEDNTSERILLWLQGESDSDGELYEKSLELLWERAKSLGFTKFLIYRVGYWGRKSIVEIMKAQESFCNKTQNAYIITRAASFMKYPGLNEDAWFKNPPTCEYFDCRDSYKGFNNNHLNEKGFKLLAERSVPNIIRVLNGENPVLEPENIIPLMR
jgi:hypothetical protein